MTQIFQTDNALIDLLESCSFPGVSIESSPHSWDDGYLQRLLGDLPAIRIAFTSADPYDDTATSTVLDMMGIWECYVCTGWNGTGQVERRKAVGGGFDLLHRAAAALHTAILKDQAGNPLPQVHVDGIEVVSDSSLDISNIWVAAIRLKIDLPLELLPSESCFGPLDDWLRVRGDIDLPDPAADVGIAVDLPQ